MMKKYTLIFLLFIFAGITSVMAQDQPDANLKGSDSSVDNFVLNDAVKMYPNPVERFLTIRSSLPVTRVRVYNLLGDQVRDVRSNFLRIDLRDLNSGIYMIKIHSNQYAVTKKLIKK